MPDFYLRRVARTLGEDVDPKSPGTEAELVRRIASIEPRDDSNVLREARFIAETVEQLQTRGGRVVFVAMPSSGLVREIEARRYPRAQFWDRFLHESGAAGIHAAYEPTLREFVCPDGSHLDMRDRARFTEALARALKERGFISAHTVRR
jgi:hypothetical protein